MDRIRLLQSRKKQILDAGKDIRKDINSLVDDKSFVELSVFSFSESEFYGENAEGEGVITGFATIDGFPFYIVAQNFAVLSGGISKANCEKIVKCLNQAEKADAPVIYLLSSLGVRVGEGVNALEGLAELILKASQLKGSVSQYLIVNGEVYGQTAVLAGICDFTFFIDKKSVLAVNSPMVIAAKSGVNKTKTEVGGADALQQANLCSFKAKNIAEIKDIIVKINSLTSTAVTDCDNLNDVIPELDKKTDSKTLLGIFDKGTLLELGGSFSPEIKCILGRVGGISVAAAVFDGQDGVELSALNIRKLKDFAEFACCCGLPYINFVNARGIKADLNTNNSIVLKEIGEYVSVLDCIDAPKISVICGKAVGIGYTLFAAKSMGYDYSYAFATSKAALFDGAQGAEIEFTDVKDIDKEKLALRYSEDNSDPINAAKCGYIDNIVQPSLIKQYLITSLQMLLK